MILRLLAAIVAVAYAGTASAVKIGFYCAAEIHVEGEGVLLVDSPAFRYRVVDGRGPTELWSVELGKVVQSHLTANGIGPDSVEIKNAHCYSHESKRKAKRARNERRRIHAEVSKHHVETQFAPKSPKGQGSGLWGALGVAAGMAGVGVLAEHGDLTAADAATIANTIAAGALDAASNTNPSTESASESSDLMGALGVLAGTAVLAERGDLDLGDAQRVINTVAAGGDTDDALGALNSAVGGASANVSTTGQASQPSTTKCHAFLRALASSAGGGDYVYCYAETEHNVYLYSDVFEIPLSRHTPAHTSWGNHVKSSYRVRGFGCLRQDAGSFVGALEERDCQVKINENRPDIYGSSPIRAWSPPTTINPD